jgi:hypothetical protein
MHASERRMRRELRKERKERAEKIRRSYSEEKNKGGRSQRVFVKNVSEGKIDEEERCSVERIEVEEMSGKRMPRIQGRD